MNRFVISCGLLLVFLAVATGCKSTKETERAETISTVEETNSTNNSDRLEAEKKEKEERMEQKKEDLVREFGKRWVNYSSIDERNSSVKSLMTEDCQKENGITVTTHADFNATGQVEGVYASVSEPNSYVFFGTEEYKGNRKKIVLTIQVEVDQEDVKVSKLVVSYVQQAY